VAWAYTPGEFQSRIGASQRERAYNLRLGDLQFDLAGRLRLAFDDNSNRASAAGRRQEALTLEYGCDVGVYYPVSYDLRLDATFYAGYANVIAGDGGVDGFIARATEATALAVDLRVGGNGLLSFVDTVRTHHESLDAPLEEGPGTLRELENDMALQYEHQLSKTLRPALRLGRYDLRSLNGEFGNRDRITHYVGARLDWRADRESTIWPYGRLGESVHPEKQHNDGTEFEFGLGWLWQMSKKTRIELAGGWQGWDFDPSNVPEATEDETGPTGKFVMISQVTRRINHGATVKYYRRIGTIPLVNFTRDLRATYRLDWSLTRRVQLTGFLHWLNVEQCGPNGIEEEYLVTELQLGYRYNRFSCYIGYTHTDKQSDRSDYEFLRNEYTFGVRHNF